MAQVVVNSGKARGGRRTVVYRDLKGNTWAALVVGEGTGSGKKLKLVSHPTVRIVDNVPLATSMKGTNVYFNYWSRY